MSAFYKLLLFFYTSFFRHFFNNLIPPACSIWDFWDFTKICLGDSDLLSNFVAEFMTAAADGGCASSQTTTTRHSTTIYIAILLFPNQLQHKGQQEISES